MRSRKNRIYKSLRRSRKSLRRSRKSLRLGRKSLRRGRKKIKGGMKETENLLDGLTNPDAIINIVKGKSNTDITNMSDSDLGKVGALEMIFLKELTSDQLKALPHTSNVNVAMRTVVKREKAEAMMKEMQDEQKAIEAEEQRLLDRSEDEVARDNAEKEAKRAERYRLAEVRMEAYRRKQESWIQQVKDKFYKPGWRGNFVQGTHWAP